MGETNVGLKQNACIQGQINCNGQIVSTTQYYDE